MVAILAPVFAAIAVAVLLDSGLPVLYSQERVGQGFRRFRIWKFRSMRRNNSGHRITARGDSRITRVGKFLRATKLDELPQFWNVFVGDMSLVGPRPEVFEYVEMYRERYRGILTVRPGITDLATMKFRDEENVLGTASGPHRVLRAAYSSCQARFGGRVPTEPLSPFRYFNSAEDFLGTFARFIILLRPRSTPGAGRKSWVGTDSVRESPYRS